MLFEIMGSDVMGLKLLTVFTEQFDLFLGREKVSSECTQVIEFYC